MYFFDWQGTRRRHSRRYGNSEQRRQTEKDAMSCHVLGRDWYYIRSTFRQRGHLWRFGESCCAAVAVRSRAPARDG